MLSTLSKGCWNPLEFQVTNPGSSWFSKFALSSLKYIQLLKKTPQNNWSCWKVSRRPESERNISASLQIPVRKVFQMPIPCQPPALCSLGWDKVWLEHSVMSHNLSEINTEMKTMQILSSRFWPKPFAFPAPKERRGKTPRKSGSCSRGGCKGLGSAGPSTT